jgi:hypothetical protein
MNEPNQALEDLLRSSEPEMPDAGFSESVLKQLPAKQWKRIPARRWTLAGAAGLGSMTTWLLAEPIEQTLSAYAVLPAPLVTIAAMALIVSLPIAWVLYSE